ncbi:right-handed parallel beta-helix repeat-containing protein [Erythrobacter sp. LQ02-29]|uniref:parallel beta-helix domain-containing protein n=1 Tax=Erythrobacter sp. LQ02-29 TaxID=2920384 RepID=UPI001F4E29C9|nr:parallel beta-helix domain-containing protein [Erythrobacter sp. LQ02-29]MCP9223562.1 right-handed parallel beta-helix repeat-containing protein [Erythrobacter sp. LQ02-29]
MQLKHLVVAALAALSLAACNSSPPTDADGFVDDPEFEQRLQEQLLDAKAGDVIEIPAGKYRLKRSLSLSGNDVTLRGEGMDKTILSFADQTSGAEGLTVTGDDFTLEDLAIEDTKGDALKINGTKNAVIRRVRAEWTGEPSAKNGAYGLYPVQVENVLIENSVVRGASDAGIYVGQSNNVIVRNNIAEGNVAGIEIENTSNADVYGNKTTNNSGGILVFNMPDLPVPGARTRVHDNEVVANNHANFAAPGSAVSSVPPGSGVIVNSNDEVEIFDNRIADNNTANVIISSYYSTGFADRGLAKAYDPYPENIYVTGNTFSGGGTNPGKAYAGLKQAVGGALPAVIWDGFANPDKASTGICVDNGDAQLLDADGPNKLANPHIVKTANCAPASRLPKITLPSKMTTSG